MSKLGMSEIVTVFAAVLALIAGYILNFVSLEAMIIVVGLIALLYISNIVFLYYLSKRIMPLELFIEEVSLAAKTLGRKIPLLLSEQEIIDIERKTKTEVWVATLDLENDLGTFLEVVQFNIHRNVLYHYILPRNKQNEIKAAQLVKLSRANGQMRFFFVDEFPYTTEIVIYDPLEDHSRAYLVLPVNSDECFVLLTDPAKVRDLWSKLLNLAKIEIGPSR